MAHQIYLFLNDGPPCCTANVKSFIARDRVSVEARE